MQVYCDLSCTERVLFHRNGATYQQPPEVVFEAAFIGIRFLTMPNIRFVNQNIDDNPRKLRKLALKRKGH
jgi:hypothetical protein